MSKFKSFVKKLPVQFQQIVLDAVENISADPEAGELKIGDLQDFRVYKLKINRQLTLIAYKIQNDSVILYLAGSHQNFYKNLKKYLKEIGE